MKNSTIKFPPPAIGAPPLLDEVSTYNTTDYGSDSIIVPETGLPLSQLSVVDILFVVGELYRKETNQTIGINRLCYDDDRLLDAVCRHRRSNGRTRLHFAARKRDVQRVRRLLGSGCDPNAKLDIIFWTPLLVLALPDDHGQFDSPYYTYPSSKTAPKGIGNTEDERKMDLQQREALIAEALIKYRANVDATTSQNESVVTLASWQGKLPLVKVLLQAKAKPDIKSNSNECGIIYSATGEHVEIAELLLDYGADPNSMNKGGANPLIAAADRNLVSLAKKLLEKGADPDVVTLQNRDTPLIFAAWKGHYEIVKLLIAAGANVNHRNNSYSNPFDYAIRHQHEDIAIELLNGGVDPDYVDSRGNTILLTAATEKKFQKLIKAVLAKGANINAKSLEGNTALMISCKKKDTDTFFTLLDWSTNNSKDETKPNTTNHRLDLNAVDKYGRTALMLAIQAYDTNLASVLIQNGADITLKCESGHTAYKYAKDAKLTTVVQLLEDRMG